MHIIEFPKKKLFFYFIAKEELIHNNGSNGLISIIIKT